MVNPIVANIARRRAQHLGAHHAYQPFPANNNNIVPLMPNEGRNSGPLQPYHPPMPTVPGAPGPAGLNAPAPAHQSGYVTNWRRPIPQIDYAGIGNLEASAGGGNRLALQRIYQFIHSPAAAHLTPKQWAVINAKAAELRHQVYMNRHSPAPDARPY